MRDVWQLRDRNLKLDRPLIMGVLNVTPDSFSDGGQFFSRDAAIEHAMRLRDEGADIIDVGGESTRPQGAVRVDAVEELRRVIPVIAAIAESVSDVVVSVDTVKADVAKEAVKGGAQIVNDVSAFRLDRRMGEICAGTGAGVVLMHSRGGVTDMGTYAHAQYDDVVDEVCVELRQSVDAAIRVGVGPDRIAVDPGIGFAKRSEHSLNMLAALPRLAEWGYPVVVGVSRKRFLGEIAGVSGVSPAARVHATVGANVAALHRGARIFRVHDVAANRQALDAAWAVMQRETEASGRP
ncbi:MAG TPA: dihydropteroate synthase [Gemmatimonadaceae bacterium]|nr:dihydropteroate synthase [Gemmatimonadaceae bacterium]